MIYGYLCITSVHTDNNNNAASCGCGFDQRPAAAYPDLTLQPMDSEYISRSRQHGIYMQQLFLMAQYSDLCGQFGAGYSEFQSVGLVESFNVSLHYDMSNISRYSPKMKVENKIIRQAYISSTLEYRSQL